MNAQADGALESMSEDFAAVSKVVRGIERQERISIETFANWKLAFRMFRELDLRFAMAKAPATLQARHRAMFAAFLALNERLNNSLKEIPDSQLSQIGLSQEGFGVCLKVVRQKYNAWYVPIDPKLELEFNEKIAALSK